jgi:hypothetical protein
MFEFSHISRHSPVNLTSGQERASAPMMSLPSARSSEDYVFHLMIIGIQVDRELLGS